ncbi:MAG: DUF3237 domain-containing protein [Hyphomicrobiales bacterium]|nr:DUF3237 domain-containing protein [Hyphomicrobiales bacterium]
MTELNWRPLFTFFLDIKKPFMLGKTPGADRRIAELPGGYFEGERLRGTIRPSGSDWQSLRDDGSVTINVRTLLETDDGALISMTYTGVRHGPQDILDAIARGESVNPNSYYMRVVPVFETASEKYGWLNRVVAVAQGHRLSNGAIYNVFEIT